MANIAGYLTNIENAERGEDVRDSIVNALNKIIQDNPVSMKQARFTANGTYSSDNGWAWNSITVDVPEGKSNAISLKSLKITENGEYEPEEGEAFSSIEVDVPLEEMTILPEKEFTTNGEWSALEDGYDGVERVVINVQSGGTGTYTVKFFAADRTTQIGSVVGVPAGGGATYTGPIPTSSGMRFVGWTPNPVNVNHDMNCYPRFENLTWDPTQILDDWVTIAKNCQKDPDYYNIGQYKLLELAGIPNPEPTGYQSERPAQTIKMVFAAKGVDKLEGNNGYANTTWISSGPVYPVVWLYRRSPADSRSYRDTYYREFFNTIFAQQCFPQDVLPYVKKVTKYTSSFNDNGSQRLRDYPSTELFWPPSFREMMGGMTVSAHPDEIGRLLSIAEVESPIYDGVFGTGDLSTDASVEAMLKGDVINFPATSKYGTIVNVNARMSRTIDNYSNVNGDCGYAIYQKDSYNKCATAGCEYWRWRDSDAPSRGLYYHANANNAARLGFCI